VSYQANSFESAHDRQLQVHQGNVGAVVPEKRDRLFPGGSAGHMRHVGLTSNHELEASQDETMIVYAQNPDLVLLQ
jgi:hypothetical protein